MKQQVWALSMYFSTKNLTNNNFLCTIFFLQINFKRLEKGVEREKFTIIYNNGGEGGGRRLKRKKSDIKIYRKHTNTVQKKEKLKGQTKFFETKKKLKFFLTLLEIKNFFKWRKTVKKKYIWKVLFVKSLLNM